MSPNPLPFSQNVQRLHDALLELAAARKDMLKDFNDLRAIRRMEIAEDAIARKAGAFAQEILDLWELRTLLVGGLAQYTQHPEQGLPARTALERGGVNPEDIEKAQAAFPTEAPR